MQELLKVWYEEKTIIFSCFLSNSYKPFQCLYRYTHMFYQIGYDKKNVYIVVIDMFSSIFYRDIFTIWYSLFNQFIIFGPDITNLVKNWCKQHKIHQILMQIMVRQACDLINLWTNIHISLKIGEISGILIHPFT